MIAELAGYISDEKVVIIVANQFASVTMNLIPITSDVSIKTNAPSGMVMYGRGSEDPIGKPFQNGTIVLPDLRPGMYTVWLTPNDESFKPGSKSMKVPTDGSNLAFVITLERVPEEQKGKQGTGPRRYFALLIGNNTYKTIQRLQTAERDASEVRDVLRDRYDFETKVLMNANRQQIISSLNEYRRKLGPNDLLLIYYAGHGYRDAEVDKAYWLPVDAALEDSSNWISADDITTAIKGIPARHVLIVSDSCYSGTIDRGLEASVSEPLAREKFIRRKFEGKSRMLLSSGGNEPVSDGGGAGHSVFASALLKGLSKIAKNEFTAGELFHEFIEESVTGRSEQAPEYKSIRNSGHESGEFVFVRKK